MRYFKLFKKMNIIWILSLMLTFIAQTGGAESRANEFEHSNQYKNYSVELRNFEDFKNQCDKESKKLVMVFGAHKCNGTYKDNVYRVDLGSEPDLLMNTDIEVLPEKYKGQFDVVVFECITSTATSCGNYERSRAFPNVYDLLKDDGLFLVWTDNSDDTKEQQEALEEYGFSFKERIKKHRICSKDAIDKEPPISCYDNIYLEQNTDEIKYAVIAPDESNIGDIRKSW